MADLWHPADEIRRVFEIFLVPGQVTELRALHAAVSGSSRAVTLSGYFDDRDRLINAALGIKNCRALCFIPNPLFPGVLARKHNRISVAEKDSLTRETDVSEIRWLLIDLDPVRPSGISSCENEHNAAIDLSHNVRDTLTNEGWPQPVVADSGNGAHLLYKISLRVEQKDTLQRALQSLGKRFDTADVKVDQQVSNPGRILKLYGTRARKGDNTDDRPHRLSRLLYVPENLIAVESSHLEELAHVQKKDPVGCMAPVLGGDSSISSWLESHGVNFRGPKEWNGGRLWKLTVCPWNEDHQGSAFVSRNENGSIHAGCHHTSCAGKGWIDLRAMFDDAIDASSRTPAVSLSTFGEIETTKPQLLVPGEHEGIRIGNDSFAESLRDQLPLGITIFRRGDELVSINGIPGSSTLTPIGIDRFRGVVDSAVELLKKGANGSVKYVPCTRDIASPALAGLSVDPEVPEIASVSSTPLWTRDGHDSWKITETGYNSGACHYFDQPEYLASFSVPDLSPANPEHRKRVRDLWSPASPGIFQHFPWANEASAVNMLAAILTLLVRPAIRSVVPIFACSAPLPRTGKTLLVKSICKLVFGENPCVQPLPSSEEEMNKCLFSMLRSGESVIVFDNLRAGTPINSASLASFVTSERYRGRILGSSSTASYLNRTTIFLTGNNPLFSQELSARILPIELAPCASGIGVRRELPDISNLIATKRSDTLSILHGMISAWNRIGRPTIQTSGFAGFEEWQATIRGLLGLWGLGDHFATNVDGWRVEGDSESTDVERFLSVWRAELGVEQAFTAEELLHLCDNHHLFEDLSGTSEHGRLVAFSTSKLRPLVKVARRMRSEDGRIQTFQVVLRGSRASHRGYEYQLTDRTDPTSLDSNAAPALPGDRFRIQRSEDES